MFRLLGAEDLRKAVAGLRRMEDRPRDVDWQKIEYEASRGKACMGEPCAVSDRGEAERLYRRGLRLEYFTLAYNLLEAAASIGFGLRAGSIALVGFGLDSVVESLSGLVLVWRLRMHGKVSGEEEQRVEKRAMRLVAVTFLVLGVYILYECLDKLIGREVPEPSLPGMVISALSLVVMPFLARWKRLTGERLGSRALVADSRETLACAFLSLSLFVGLGSNYLFGFWQADPIVGLAIAAFLFREGAEVWGEAGEEGEEEGEGG
ncbi:cation transporter [Candidatus Solincola tengchongensis]|uniref:cation diffusion facilitator family transporter n=1 Tax=Candidatus Solincola tengchongensis TaxID=2900693 RepID=UPI00257B8B96|nr:cation transporter [Candidatus Solincola tengchongensis]